MNKEIGEENSSALNSGKMYTMEAQDGGNRWKECCFWICMIVKPSPTEKAVKLKAPVTKFRSASLWKDCDEGNKILLIIDKSKKMWDRIRWESANINEFE